MTKNKNVLNSILTVIATAVVGEIITNTTNLIKNHKTSTIVITDWHDSYNGVNKLLYELDKESYNRRRTPTTNKNYYDLDIDTNYFIKLSKSNYIKVSTYKYEASNFFLKNLKLSFFGKDKYKNRESFLKKSMSLKDKEHIKVQYLNETRIACDIIPHDFKNIVLDNNVKDNIINGLNNWNNSKDWYKEHELVHKIGVFLYGQNGTGKSSVAKGISTMFDNAPIFTIDTNDIMRSIGELLKMRKKHSGVIIVLIEDFDMYFKSREELANIELDINQKSKKDENQNAIFQLLDGVYSTDETIYVATTNYKERIDSALIRYGRFDIQEELNFFNKEQSIELFNLFGYGEKELIEMNITYPVQPVYLQSKIMEYRAKKGN